jgi:hypothetical protein
MLVIAPKLNMRVHSVDIETAFLSAHLQNEIYMRQPKRAQVGTPRVMRLLKGIYGLKHASREWSKFFHQTLSFLGLKRATSITNLYTMNHPMHGIRIVLVYNMEDILIVSHSLKWIESAKSGPLGTNSA